MKRASRLVPDHLGRGAGRDERMEAGYRAAGDGNEQEGKQAARPDRAGAIHELRERRHLEFRRNEDDADRQTDNGADLQEGGQIVARRQQQPDRQHGGNEAIADQQPGELLARQGEQGGQRGNFLHVLPADDRQHQQDKADQRDFADRARADETGVYPHEQGNREWWRQR